MDLFIPLPSSSSTANNPSFSSSTLILPIVSLANVAQLSADLLIHSLELQRVGCLKSKYHIPLVAPVDYVEEPVAGLSTAVEVFQSKDGSLTLVQQRSPVIKSRKDAFVKALTTFVHQAGFRRVLIVAGMDAGLGQAQDFDNPSPFRYLSIPSSTLHAALSHTMSPLSSTSLSASSIPPIPSSGISRLLLSALLSSSSSSPETAESASMDVSALLMSVAEGDNRYDAHVLARCIDKVLGLQTGEEKWREPMSWRVGLYGRELDGRDEEGARGGPAELYG